MFFCENKIVGMAKFVHIKLYDIPVKKIENFEDVFELSHVISSNDNSKIYALDSNDKIIKITNISHLTSFNQGMIENVNYATLSKRLSEGIIPKYHDGFVIVTERDERFFCLILDSVSGKTLDKIEQFSDELFLYLSRWLFWSLYNIHWQNMACRDILPENIIWDDTKGELAFIDLKSAVTTTGNRADFQDSIDFKKDDIRKACEMLIYIKENKLSNNHIRLGRITEALELGLSLFEINRPTAYEMYELLTEIEL